MMTKKAHKLGSIFGVAGLKSATSILTFKENWPSHWSIRNFAESMYNLLLTGTRHVLKFLTEIAFVCKRLVQHHSYLLIMNGSFYRNLWSSPPGLRVEARLKSTLFWYWTPEWLFFVRKYKLVISEENNIIFIKTAVRFVSKQSRLQPRFYRKDRSQITQR